MPPLAVLIAELALLGQVRFEALKNGFEARLVAKDQEADLCAIGDDISIATYRLWQKALGSGQEVCA